MYEVPQKGRQLDVGQPRFGQMGLKANLYDTPGPKRIQVKPQLGESRLDLERETMPSQCLNLNLGLKPYRRVLAGPHTRGSGSIRLGYIDFL